MSIEDPFDQDDWAHYAKMTTECGTEVQIVGDDLLVTNPKVCFYLPVFTSVFTSFLSALSENANISVILFSYSRELLRQSPKSLATLFF